MPAKKKGSNSKAAPKVQSTLTGLAKKIDESGRARAGDIVFNLSGDSGGLYCLECDGRQTALSRSSTSGHGAPLVEIIGDAGTVASILEGEKDPVKVFYAGGLRIRGDIGYLSDMAVELGILDEPL